MKREEDRNMIIRDVRAQLGLIAKTAANLQGTIDQLSLMPEKQTLFGKFWQGKDTAPSNPAKSSSTPVKDVAPVQYNVFKSDDSTEALPVPTLLATTPDVVAQTFNRGALESLRAEAIASGDPARIEKWNTIAKFTGIYVTGKTIDEMMAAMNLTVNQCYTLRNAGFSSHTYGEKIQQIGARNMGAKHNNQKKKSQSLKKNKPGVMSKAGVQADVRRMSDIEARIEERLEAETAVAMGKRRASTPISGASTLVASPLGLFNNADPTLVAKFNPGPLWPRYNGFISGAPVDGDSLNAYNMDYTAINLYLHGMPTSEISSQLQIDVKPLINSMFG